MRRDVLVSRLKARICHQASLLVQGWAVGVLAWTAGCSVDNVSVPKGSIPADAQPAIGGRGGGPSTPDGSFLNVSDAGTMDSGVGCKTLTCGTGTAQRCGDVLDDCGNILHCPACPGGAPCVNNVCIGACQGCSVPGGDFCGTVGDGCGGSLNCPTTCAKAGWSCQDNICKAQPPYCVLVTCATSSGDHYCGTIGNGCGDSIDCGNDCPSGWDCINNICVGSPIICPALTCATPTGDHYCGTAVGNGCGGTLTCGDDCPTGWTCGADHIMQGAPC